MNILDRTLNKAELLLSILTLTAIAILSISFQQSRLKSAAVAEAAATSAHLVLVTGKKMTTNEKRAYDQASQRVATHEPKDQLFVAKAE